MAAGLVIVAAVAGITWQARDGRRRRGGGTVDVRDLGVVPGRVALVQFGTETCARCPQVRRMLRSVVATRSRIELIEVDLTHRPDLARRYQVLTTPTTFLVGADATVLARFHGAPRRDHVEEALAELPALQEAR
ncbi:putative thioredoxin [Microbacterium esteraromaticum]|uniref:Putative thioredoxin n=2 Tax=Microbacterium esteraromaticum TaxID=57043 RepID=A0A1R4JKQ0_9MICO|nr:putative thioredoxin [Microbacterium esteraromaticum]